MTCRHLIKKMVKSTPEIGGQMTPELSSESACRFNRPDTFGWLSKCINTPENGPCWFWLDGYGPKIPDKDFVRGSIDS